MTQPPLRLAAALVLLFTVARPVSGQDLITAGSTTANSFITSAAPTTEPAQEDGRDWFGQRPWRQWTTVSGDWNGARTELLDAGIDIAMTAKMDTSLASPIPGVARGLFTTEFAIDTDKLLGTQGGSLVVSLQGLQGQNVSEMLGVTQSVSNIDAGIIPAVSQIWYEQRFGSRIRAKAGRIDANTEFAFLDVTGDFLSASMGFSPSITSMTSYPAPTAGVMAAIEPGAGVDIRGGIFDGTAGDGEWVNWDARFAIAQVGKSWERGGAGRIVAGGWSHRSLVEDGGETTGLFSTLEQTFRVGETEAGAYLQFGASNALSPIQRHLGTGISFAGIVPGRSADSTGVGATWIRYSPDADSDSELVVEMFHRIALTPALSVAPDVQWVSRPGRGTAGSRTVVFTVRMQIEM